MTRLTRQVLAILSAVIYLLSCNSNETANNYNPIKVYVEDTFMLARKKAFAETASQLNLTPIDKGVDSFEIRIWVSSIFIEKDLLVLKYSDNTWQHQKIRFYRRPDDVVYSKQEKIKRPEISLELLVDSIRRIQFDKLLPQNEIPGFVDNVADGVWYSVEIATKGSYKQLTYHCPERFAKTEINNKKFLDLIFLLNRYYHFWMPICTE